MKRFLLIALKLGISLAIIGYLVMKASSDRAFAELAQQPKDWKLLSLAAAMFGVSLMLTHVRWYYLVRALDAPVKFWDAVRLGFLGYLFNLAPTGVVGGDVLKVMLLSRHLRGHRAKATASVLADRAIGLYLMFVVSTAAILLTGFWRLDGDIYRISLATIGLTAMGAIGLGVLFLPAAIDARITAWLGHAGRAGQILDRLFVTLRMYRQKAPLLAGSALMSVAVHALFVVGIYLTAWGLYDHVAPLSSQLVVVPLAGAAAVVPLPLGPFELGLEFLYGRLGMPTHQGLIVVLCYRIISMLIALVGVGCYLGSRQEVAVAVSEMQAPEPHGKDSVAVRYGRHPDVDVQDHSAPARRAA